MLRSSTPSIWSEVAPRTHAAIAPRAGRHSSNTAPVQEVPYFEAALASRASITLPQARLNT